MISPKQLSSLLQSNNFATRPLEELTIPTLETKALMLTLQPGEELEAWQLLKNLQPQTGAYPLVSAGKNAEDFFARFYYEEELAAGLIDDGNPTAIAASSSANLDNFLEQCQRNDAPYLEDYVSVCLENTQLHFGAAPDPSEVEALIKAGVITDLLTLERWLLTWEENNSPQGPAPGSIYTDYLDWFSVPEPRLLLLPIDHGWQSLAYVHWFGACTCGTPIAIAFLKRWFGQYQAELVGHYGTMLQFTVKNPPQSLEQAFQLAWEQYAIAPCTTILPGVDLRDYGRVLLGRDNWFLHERP